MAFYLCNNLDKFELKLQGVGLLSDFDNVYIICLSLRWI